MYWSFWVSSYPRRFRGASLRCIRGNMFNILKGKKAVGGTDYAGRRVNRKDRSGRLGGPLMPPHHPTHPYLLESARERVKVQLYYLVPTQYYSSYLIMPCGVKHCESNNILRSLQNVGYYQYLPDERLKRQDVKFPDLNSHHFPSFLFAARFSLTICPDNACHSSIGCIQLNSYAEFTSKNWKSLWLVNIQVLSNLTLPHLQPFPVPFSLTTYRWPDVWSLDAWYVRLIGIRNISIVSSV